MAPHPVQIPPQEKSSAIALLLTILFPGAGHLYLGLTQKSIPHMVANAFGVVLALTVILLPITFVIWLVTLVMTVGSLTRDTETVNEAIRAGRPINS